MAETVVRNRVTREKFVEVNAQASKEGHGIKWIAAQLGLSEAYVAQRRTNLRSQGVALPELSRGGTGNSKLNTDALNASIAAALGKTAEEVAADGQELVKAAAARKAEREAADAPADKKAE
jgi:hypothetical protein